MTVSNPIQSDSFVAITVLNTGHQIPVVKLTINTDYPPKTPSTFNFPLYFSLTDKLGTVELVV
jgi:phosphatidylserine decarboxylase